MSTSSQANQDSHPQCDPAVMARRRDAKLTDAYNRLQAIMSAWPPPPLPSAEAARFLADVFGRDPVNVTASQQIPQVSENTIMVEIAPRCFISLTPLPGQTPFDHIPKFEEWLHEKTVPITPESTPPPPETGGIQPGILKPSLWKCEAGHVTDHARDADKCPVCLRPTKCIKPAPEKIKRMARPRLEPAQVWMVHIVEGQFSLTLPDGEHTWRLVSNENIPRRMNGIARLHPEFPNVVEVHTYASGGGGALNARGLAVEI